MRYKQVIPLLVFPTLQIQRIRARRYYALDFFDFIMSDISKITYLFSS